MKRKVHGSCFLICLFSVPSTCQFTTFKTISWHLYRVSSWSRTMFHFLDCYQFSSFYIVPFKLGNVRCLWNEACISTTLTSPTSCNYSFSLLDNFSCQQKVNFVETERQEKSLFIKMKRRISCRDNWLTASVRTWKIIFIWKEDLSSWFQRHYLWLPFCLAETKDEGNIVIPSLPLFHFLWFQLPATTIVLKH